MLSLATNGLLMLTVAVVVLSQPGRSPSDLAPPSFNSPHQAGSNQVTAGGGSVPMDLGPRHKWTYDQWVAQLEREAAAAAANKPENLAILAGDSISLWFPTELLPNGKNWLNQGISGETSAGLLKRLSLLDNTSPSVVFVMIGINDLIRGVPPEEILENSRLIIRDLLWVHPNAKVVLQSILPHSGPGASWEGRDRLLAIPNQKIREINRSLKEIAAQEGATYLDLHPLFADDAGNLSLLLTTDGLHLNQQGYLVWRSALILFMQLQINA
ncbi:MAG TPA: GDSL family lipase [Oscillatoriaceae cyanobacterium M33_DOE_052]|uniref:GDSL family lipase n=1 Tax=Planktothricoides sp. SpSt-374 TaxID=2282167 RepID=A0A7C3VNH7_9CYAN|nr:GDSL family lipase [Oscillatoriaceae cyanobacterium M33_DOE_052]